VVVGVCRRRRWCCGGSGGGQECGGVMGTEVRLGCAAVAAAATAMLD